MTSVSSDSRATQAHPDDQSWRSRVQACRGGEAQPEACRCYQNRAAGPPAYSKMLSRPVDLYSGAAIACEFLGMEHNDKSCIHQSQHHALTDGGKRSTWEKLRKSRLSKTNET